MRRHRTSGARLTDNNARATTLTEDGVDASHLASTACPMASQRSRLCCSSTAALQHTWEDEDGAVLEIQQGEGGEQGDPLMPALFALA